ncbi:Ent-kaurene oxidase [Diplodia seriata]|uniref:Ent-kaurene oxidase n=1 Tax=Diplodia seriata TaxID=420778 RepID=A0A1S8B1S8_9PEZI|nr:Ent-kaurene oxidase [Diplodia seriata]
MMSRMLQSRYLLPAHPADEVFHASTIRVDLNRHLAALTSDIADEIRAGLADAWGTDTSNFRSVCVLDTVKHISTRISTPVFFGQELTRDADFLAHTGAFSTMLTTCSGLLALFAPRALRPLLGPLVALPARYHAWSMNRKLLPLIQRRLTTLSSSSSPPLPKKCQPNDLLQYHVASALASPSPSDRLPATIAARLQLLLGFAAIPTIHLTLGNALLNLSACPPPPPSPAVLSLDAIGPADPSPPSPTSPEALFILRNEASTVLGEHGGTWTRPSLLQLVRADSFLKETMRLDIFAGRGLLHEVVAEGGVALPGEGAVVPKGAWVGVAASEMQKDEDVYGPGAGEFEGWRFVVGEAKNAEEKDDMGGAGKGRSMSTTSDMFLAFSRGRHTCPGRFFAANVMKLVLAHVAMEYDIRPLEKRPENVTISDVSVPPGKARIEVRRRERVLC